MLALLLLLLTRDGVIHWVHQDGREQSTQAAPHASAVAGLADSRVAVLAGDRLAIVSHGRNRTIPGHFADVKALAGGADANALYALVADGAVRIDVVSGQRRRVVTLPRAHRLATDGDALFVEADGVIVEAGTAHAWRVTGHPIALAAGSGDLWIATKEGPLIEIDRATSVQRELGLGNWFGTLGLAYADGGLFAVTVAGKLWRIDPQRREKTIVTMDGWQGAIDLAVLR
ncbi:MAG TPA: hypothetical protein VHB97_03305 [Polyangia bacterium]|nr:hypothetical protein [Polyangia bacterium]